MKATKDHPADHEMGGSPTSTRLPASTCHWDRDFLSDRAKIKAKGNNALPKIWQSTLIKAFPLTK